MGMNQTPASERVHISFFGKRNAGKSSVINAVTGQDLAIVSSVRGTTTDPVYKTMELLPLGPVMIIDTPGIDDEGELGALRVRKSYQVLNKTDIAILVVDSTTGKGEEELALIHRFHKKGIPYLVVYNKIDLLSGEGIKDLAMSVRPGEVLVSAADGMNIQELKEKIATLKPEDTHKYPLLQDLIEPLDLVILVVPIDKAAPKGRLILPQQQTIRDILERGALSLVVRDTELKSTLDHFLAQGVCPKLVVTDSQAFARVSKDVPENITLTSFSILFSRYKGELETQLEGVAALSSIQDDDRILIAEGCTHHRQCGDIGTCKIPNWIRNYTGKKPVFEFTSGTEFPDDVSSYKMVVHCGGCMLNEREMKYRIACCHDQGVPITNYGLLIAQVTGILKRSLGPFPEMQKLV
ncbi:MULTISPECIES: [FeFe] hydrogenase H-cluster maturation GTPase HydF [Blautia]|uniref:Iron-only hydrogenase maturation protein HydF n=2 Tax=Blautia obeum TaxID=40520 RepID=D4LQR3_9FIRM|nr:MULTISPECIES: [FeFe] hydrogenase H-cluster maturation GTPase HydF [Blautia]RHA50891.1 [FeFe] hydrogenase H-cluster maturation GTPase HydF [Blautia obeum]RHE40769.1 [FeFe] hydrogenase H-cluster maturation GTPase HydF [Blautia obeum]CBL23121.1 iron-only hydrogenase maturation protein HydF [Blautia obeum A2-162]